MNCGYCQDQLNAGARFCSRCGHPVPVNASYSWGFPQTYGRLMRARQGKMIGGVCAGLANHFGWDPVVVRLVVLAGMLLGCGTLLLAYLAAWIVIPIEPLYYVPMYPTAVPPGGFGGGPAGPATGTSAGGTTAS